MSNARAIARLDPALGRLPAAAAQALFAGDAWEASAELALVTALAAASPHTRSAWANDWAVFRRWALGRAACWLPEERARVRLPVLPELLVRFIEDMAAGYAGSPPRAIGTIRRYLATLATLHRLLDCPDPTKAAIVANALKARARGSGGPGQAAPLRWADVEEAIRVLPEDLAGLRDKTLLAVAHNTLARRAELVALDVDDVELLPEAVALVALRPTKARLEAAVEHRYLAPATTALVRAWLAESGLRTGALFVAMHRNGLARRSNGRRGAARELLANGRRLTDKEVNVIIKLAMGRLAVARGELRLPEGPPAARRRALLAHARAYSGHSPRIGAAQDMAAAGVSSAAMLQAGGWSDERMLKRYLRKLGALEGGMAQLFRDGGPR
ncbi:MAG: tyrosine-type recombinase/integrase [Chromatiaceae bacterium]